MPKERSVNPVAAQHKADKKAALKKSKAATQSQRNERLAKRNPDRLERQVQELKDLEASTGSLRHKDREQLAHLERELKAVRKARDVLGDKAPVFRTAGGGRTRDAASKDGAFSGTAQGNKRRREDESETDEDVRTIPMPRDTPPPIPRRYQVDSSLASEDPKEPRAVQRQQQTVYSAEPQMRDIGREVRRFVPAAVATKMARTRPEPGKLLEPEELDRLEAEGYGAARKAATEAEHEAEFEMMADAAANGNGADVSNEDVEKALRKVEVEEMVDEDA